MNRLSRVRVITWIWLAFNVLVLVGLLVGGGASINSCLPPDDILKCLKSVASSYVVWTIWLPGNIVLGIVWVITRLAARRCPACRLILKTGEATCPACGHSASGTSLRDRLPRMPGTTGQGPSAPTPSPAPPQSTGSFEDW